MPSPKISLWKKVNRKGKKNSLYLIYNIVSLSKMAGKIESFSGKIGKYELVVKYLEKLVTERIYCYFE